MLLEAAHAQISFYQIFALIGTSLFAVLPFIKKRMDKRLVDE